MSYYIGIDLGTSGVKVLMISEKGIEKVLQEEYTVSYPKPEYSEQNPLDWYKQTISALKELFEGVDKSRVKSISFSGQMHGLVMLDKNDEIVRPAILWNDGRSVKEVDYLNKEIGTDFLLENTGNIAFAGFTAPKLLWVKNNEPENFGKAFRIMLPKDYLAYRLSGIFATDVSDAAGTLYFDTKNRRWSKPLLEIIGISEDMLPVVYESYEVIGKLKTDIADELGLGYDVDIVIGAGDNAASAVGTNTINDGSCNISLGTSGTIFVETVSHSYDKNSAIHAFCSASGKYHYLACILSAASCQKWWFENILHSDYKNTSLDKYMENSDIIFLPYLMGERSPINSPEAKATFYGMTPNTTKEEMTLAVLEGVAFALKQNIEIIRSLGVKVERSGICGGGAKNKLWLEIIANVLNITLEISKSEQGGALGAALLAAKGVMKKDKYNTFKENFFEICDIIVPDEKRVKYYDKKYKKYLTLQKAVLSKQHF